MGRQDEIVQERLRKIKELRENKINPYAHKSDSKDITSQLQEKYKSLKPEESKKDDVSVSGRLLGLRDLGKIAFGTLDDGKGKIQLLLQDGETPKAVFEFVKKYVDSGDFIQAHGTILRTKRGELSVVVKEIKLLTKSIYPLPEKWHGIQDEEERYRKRYLDIAMNTEMRAMFERKSKFWQTMRSFLLENGFMEVETPVLESTTGGAEARPFTTHHNALDIDMYLRISPELWLKRLMVAGYPKVFEIGRIFRNEGMDAEHLQDYTQMEFYWAYADYNDGMKLVEDMYKHIAKETFGTLKFKIKDFDVDLGKKWEIYDFVQTIKKMTGIDVLDTTLEEVESKLKNLEVDYDRHGFNLNRGVDNLWKYCRRKIAGPGFLINVPVFMEPLAKRMEDKTQLVERYQIILAGSELGKGFTELNDPIDQLGRFEDQQKLREQGDEEAQMKDDDFVEALKYGMPPTTGFGVSERLFSFLEGKPIRETTIFPLMRPEKKETKKEVKK
ncbi:MAG TPA: lysine--tRNA ligase [Candidatus Nanoarchaeia archaeon]|nr:lysine--tRNA ligase [Candidatus Nanoarchaeia archaeon]